MPDLPTSWRAWDRVPEERLELAQEIEACDDFGVEQQAPGVHQVALYDDVERWSATTAIEALPDKIAALAGVTRCDHLDRELIEVEGPITTDQLAAYVIAELAATGDPSYWDDRETRATAGHRDEGLARLAGHKPILPGGPHEVSGVVAHCDDRRREWAFPTANVISPRHLPTGDERLRRLERPPPTAPGPRPSASAGAPVLRGQGQAAAGTYLLNWDGDLYDQQAKVRFTQHLRGQERFPELDDVLVQIGENVKTRDAV